MWNSDDITDKNNTLGIPKANLELKYSQMFITYFNIMQW